MKLVRPAVAVAVGVSLVLAGSAGAAPKKKVPPVCNLATDPAGDTFLVRNQDTAGGPYGPQEDALDLVSADLASDKKTITAVMRVKKLALTIQTGLGQGYELQFSNSGANPLYLGATIRQGVMTFTSGYRDATTNTATSLGEASGVFDVAKNEIRISAPVSNYEAQGAVKPGTKLALGTITASRNVVAANVFGDVAVGEKVYTAGAKSCVTPGK